MFTLLPNLNKASSGSSAADYANAVDLHDAIHWNGLEQASEEPFDVLLDKLVGP